MEGRVWPCLDTTCKKKTSKCNNLLFLVVVMIGEERGDIVLCKYAR